MTNGLVADVPGCIVVCSCIAHQFLTDSLSDHYDRVWMTSFLKFFVESLFKAMQQAVFTFHRERDLRDQNKINIGTGKGSIGGDETGIPSHQLDDDDAIIVSEGFRMSCLYSFYRL